MALKDKKFRFVSDPGHGWLAVKRSDLESLNVLDKITSYSYQKGKTVYLEEDCDASTFLRAYENKFGKRAGITFGKHYNSGAPIRSYTPFFTN